MLKNEKKYGLATKAIHAGQEPDKSTGAIMVPIYASSTYVQESPGKHKGYEYSRTQNPTRVCVREMHCRPRKWATWICLCLWNVCSRLYFISLGSR